MRVGIHEAKTNFSKLIPAVQAGEEVIITNAGRPVARLVPFRETGGGRPLGLYRSSLTIHGDLLASLPDEIVNDFWPGGKEQHDLPA